MKTLDKELQLEERKLSFLEYFLIKGKTGRNFILVFLVSFLAIGLAIFNVYSALFGELQARVHRSVFLTVIMILIFLLFPCGKRMLTGKGRLFLLLDLFCIFSSLGITIYVLWEIDAFELRWGSPTTLDIMLGSIGIFLVLEATRRVVGWVMVTIALVFMMHTLFANHFWGLLKGPPTTWVNYVDWIFMQETGIWGVPIQVMASIIILFLLFGSLLIRTGAGKFFIDAAYAITGRMVGGPAKCAVISSAMFGTISGSGVANVVGTGTFTIPLMKKVGYPPEFAGAVEAVASTGGMIMPPVMGAAAFIIAQFLGMSYFGVCIAAAIPAVLYFWAVLMMVHFRAKLMGLKAMSKEELPSFREVFRKGWHLLFSICVLLFFLVEGATPMKAAVWAFLLLFFLSFVRKETRLTPISFLSSLEEGTRSALSVTMACACAGIIIGSVYVSGIGMRFSNILVSAAGGALWLTLIYVMIASLILGMGLPPTAVYLTLSTVVVPALIDLKVIPIAAHLFCFYFGCIGNITPPVALAAFAAAGIAGSNPSRTGFVASQIGIASFIVPYMFIYGPSLLMIGKPIEILWAATTGTVGVIFLAGGVQGWLIRKATYFERTVLIAAAILLIKPGLITDTIGFALALLVITIQKLLPYREVMDKKFIDAGSYIISFFKKSTLEESSRDEK
jgi:TRAP transporter 4TM/12TM fusion protein